MRRWLLVLIPIIALGAATAAIVARGHEEPPTVEVAAEPTAAPTPPLIVVDVVAAIAHPGVVRLPAGSRGLDALLAAGGITGDADLFPLNKAAPLRAGVPIYAP